MVKAMGDVTGISVGLQSPPPLSPIGPSQGEVLTTTRYIETFTDQLLEEDEALSFTQQPDEGDVTGISVDTESPPGSSGHRKWFVSNKRKLAHSLEDLEPDLADQLRPYTRQRFTKREKLTELQAVYFTGMFTFSFPLCVEAS